MTNSTPSKQNKKAMIRWMALPFLLLALFTVSCVGTRGMGVDVKVYEEETILMVPEATEPVEVVLAPEDGESD